MRVVAVLVLVAATAATCRPARITVVGVEAVRQHVSVDQGLAAVLGAGVGVLGTLGTACLTYLATRQQTIDQERVEHGQWLRQQRQRAYEDLLLAYDRFAGAATALEEALKAEQTEGLEDSVTGLKMAFDEFGSARVRVAVAGPHRVSQSAGKIATLFRTVQRALMAWHEDQISGSGAASATAQVFELQKQIQVAYRDFVREVRIILESPPSATIGASRHEITGPERGHPGEHTQSMAE